jgi:tRNA A-37 threonylcarbamoyl transferase component Bud32
MKLLDRIYCRIQMWMIPVRALGARTGESLSLLYDLREKPWIVLYWFKTALRIHIGFVVAVVIAVFSLSLVTHAALQRAFKQKSLTVLVSGLTGARSRGDIQRERTQRFFYGLFIFAGSTAMGLRLLTEVRASIGYSVRASRSLTREADAALENDPSQSLVLYRSAAGLTCYPGDESALRKKIVEAEKSVAAGRKAPRPTGGPSSTEPSPTPQSIGDRYTIVDQLGRGASGTVYRANDDVLERAVALKELTITVADDDTRARFRREAKILARLNHPNIVQIFDLLEHGSRIWIAMELVEGGDLASLLARHGRLNPEQVAVLGGRMADALLFAHNRGVIHRDIKPLNVLLVDDSNPKITDFGLAKLSEGNVHTIEGMVLGSPRYMSPEQAEGGRVDQRSDIYSLGILLYHMLSGNPPFSGDVRSVLMQHVRRKANPLLEVAPDVPPAMAGLVDQMLSKDPADRPAGMDVVADQLGSLLETLQSV